MFIVPLSLFLLATYIRPRTHAELSYLITAIECLSGLWCLLFAPFQIQLSLVGLLLIQNREGLKSLLNRDPDSNGGYLDLSNTSNPAIDIDAQSLEPSHPKPNKALASHPQPSFTVISTSPSPEISELTTPEIPTNTIANVAEHQSLLSAPSETSPRESEDDIATPEEITIPEQIVKLQYRGTTYYKSIPPQPVKNFNPTASQSPDSSL